jgi:hypothetical protein
MIYPKPLDRKFILQEHNSQSVKVLKGFVETGNGEVCRTRLAGGPQSASANEKPPALSQREWLIFWFARQISLPRSHSLARQIPSPSALKVFR